jgi:phosphoglycolate phosphatase
MTPQGQSPHDAVIFDLDGTLVDTLPDIQYALNRLLGEAGFGALSLSDVTGMIGGGVASLVDRAIEAVGAPSEPANRARWTARFHALYSAEPVRLSRPYPGAQAVLSELAQSGCRLAVCTNKPQDIATAILRHLDLLSPFDAVFGDDGVRPRKPDPTIIREAMTRLGSDAGSTIVVGDGAADLGAARGAGASVVLVTYGYGSGLQGLGADLLIDELGALPQALGRLRGHRSADRGTRPA